MNLIILFLILSASLLKYTRATITQEECEALQELYRSTNGEIWRNTWSAAQDGQCEEACEWYGINCNDDQTHIIEL